MSSGLLPRETPGSGSSSTGRFSTVTTGTLVVAGVAAVNELQVSGVSSFGGLLSAAGGLRADLIENYTDDGTITVGTRSNNANVLLSPHGTGSVVLPAGAALIADALSSGGGSNMAVGPAGAGDLVLRSSGSTVATFSAPDVAFAGVVSAPALQGVTATTLTVRALAGAADAVGNHLTLTAGAGGTPSATGKRGGDSSLSGGAGTDGAAGSMGGAGGDASLTAGKGGDSSGLNVAAPGGDIVISAGKGGDSTTSIASPGGTVTITGGIGGDSQGSFVGVGGPLFLRGGNAGDPSGGGIGGGGGAVTISGGNVMGGTDAFGGDITIATGFCTGTANAIISLRTGIASSTSSGVGTAVVARYVVGPKKALSTVSGTPTNILSHAVKNRSSSAAHVRYTVTGRTGGGDVFALSGDIRYAVVSTGGGTVTASTPTALNEVIAESTASTPATVWALTAANPAVLSVAATWTSVTPTDVSVTFEFVNISGSDNDVTIL